MLAIPGWEGPFEQAAGEARLPVFARGAGPGVVLIHELPGMVPECIDLGRWLSDPESGFRVYMPLMFGEPGENSSTKFLVKLCVHREFTLWAAGRTSPIVDWLRHLARRVHEECGGRGVGAIGMCLSGGFALAMVLGAPVVAPVLSQPALPLGPPLCNREALDLSEEDLMAIRERCDREEIPVLGLRFERDRLCPAARFQKLRDHLGRHFEAMVLPGAHHSVLTVDAHHLNPEQHEATRAAVLRHLRKGMGLGGA